MFNVLGCFVCLDHIGPLESFLPSPPAADYLLPATALYTVKEDLAKSKDANQELVSVYQNATDEDHANAVVIVECGGIPLIVKCLSSPVRNIVNYALAALYYLCNPTTKRDILKPEVIEPIQKYAGCQGVSISFSNLANSFLDKQVH